MLDHRREQLWPILFERCVAIWWDNNLAKLHASILLEKCVSLVGFFTDSERHYIVLLDVDWLEARQFHCFLAHPDHIYFHLIMFSFIYLEKTSFDYFHLVNKLSS